MEKAPHIYGNTYTKYTFGNEFLSITQLQPQTWMVFSYADYGTVYVELDLYSPTHAYKNSSKPIQMQIKRTQTHNLSHFHFKWLVSCFGQQHPHIHKYRHQHSPANTPMNYNTTIQSAHQISTKTNDKYVRCATETEHFESFSLTFFPPAEPYDSHSKFHSS